MAYPPIAIVGRACLLPGASSPEALWELVAARRCAITAVPSGRFGLDPDLVRGTPKNAVDKTWSTRGGYVDVDVRDLPDFPGRADIAALDPLFSWTLSTAHRALVDAGFDVFSGDARARAGFVFGNLSFPTEAMTRLGEALALDDEWRAATGLVVGDLRDRFMSGLPALLASRHLGLEAFAFCLDAACASSLYAVHLAARALQDGRADVVVAGAVNRADALFLHVGFCALQALSTSGTPRPFDQAADGLVPAEGCAALTLMRLDHARAQGKTIHGVITGSGLSNDGRSRNLLSPSTEGQARALRAAWAAAGRPASTATLFECHATGTQQGDKTEVLTLREVVGPTTSSAKPISLGSLKSNLGHLITAAGAAGLLKVCEAFRHEELPPSLHVDRPIDAIDGRSFKVQTSLERWERPDGDVRRAGVSAFGFGGNDAHVVVEEPAFERRSFPVQGAIVPAKLPAVAVVAVGVRAGEQRGGLSALVQAQAAGAPAVATTIVVDTDGVRFPPNDLSESLAQQLLVFEAARDAVAPLPEGALPKERTGVFIGMGTDVAVTTPGLRWRAEHLANLRLAARHPGTHVDAAALAALRDLAMPPMSAAGVLGTMPNIPANRLSVQLDLRGAGFTVSSEERSGQDALDIARALIACGELDAALVGAVDAVADPRHTACAPGEQGADAAVVFVVMTEARAAALGLPVLGVIDDVDDAAAARPTWTNADVDAALGAAHAASGLLAVGAALACPGSTIVGTTTMNGQRKTMAVRTAERAPVRREDVAFLFGPVTPTRSLAQPWLAFPAVRRHLDAIFGDDALPLLRGERGSAGSERDLFISSASTQARFAFVRDVLGLEAAHHVGISLGESNALVAAGIWPDPRPLLQDTVAMRLFTDELGGRNNAVAALWRQRGRPELGNAWTTVCVRAPREKVNEQLARRDDVFATVWHFDDEVVLAGAPDGVAAVCGALQVTPIIVQDAPAVHVPAVALVADRYRALNRRPTGPARATVWSSGVGHDGGPIERPDSDGCADAIVTQAMRVVDVPAMLRKLWSRGVRTFVDVSPRGLVAQWATHVLPGATIIAVDGEPSAVAARLADVALGDPERLAYFTDRQSEPARALRIPAHRPPRPWPAPTPAISSVEIMPAPPRRPRLVPADLAGDVAVRAAPVPRGPSQEPAATTSTATTTMTAGAPPRAAPPAQAAAVESADEAALLAALQHQRETLLAAHRGFLDAAARAHTAFLHARHATLAALTGAAAPATSATPATPAIPATQATTPPQRPAPVSRERSVPAVSSPAAVGSLDPAPAPLRPTPSTVLYDRAQLVSLASEPISKVLGPTFARQDGFRRQVRMPEPPLLLCDRVLSTTATPGKLEKGKQIVTATDVRADAWYLHEGRVPAGVLIETGQADLLLISLMGVDFENRGERVYRLLGCDLTYTDHLPTVGDVLVHDIVIDGFATAAISSTSEARIFFFHSETRLGSLDGPLVLRVRNGQAGFFTDDELAHSGGVLWKPADEDAATIAALPHDGPRAPTKKQRLSREELLAFARGDALRCFGDGFATCATHVRTPRIEPPREGRDPFGNPDGRFIDMLLVDRVTELSFDRGPWGRGHLRAELDLHAEKWFYEGHFKDDPCMPGTIMFQGCLQVAAIYLAACGAILDKDGFRFEPKLGHEMTLRCRGQATPSSKSLVYDLFVKSVRGGMSPELHCDILVTVDGLKSLHCKDVIVALVPDSPVTSRLDLLGVVPKPDGKDAIAPRSVASSNRETKVTGFASLLATGIGRPSKAFPGLYDVYDDGTPVARLPGPPYHFMSNVDAVTGPPMGSLFAGRDPAGTKAVVRYDVPDDAWYFTEARRSQGGTMPFAVLLEVALQPCGWISSYVGSTRTSPRPLRYRNLDGKATQHAEVRPDVGALITTAELTKSSSSGGMIIQEFTFDTRAADGSPVFSGSTVFGFFPSEALSRQVGVGSTEADRARLAAPPAPGDDVVAGVSFPVVLRETPPRFFGGAPQLPWPRGEPTLLMLDRIEGAWRNDRGLLRVRTAKDVVVDDWFFKAHFFQDPVQPGSLGLEAMVQGLQWACIADDIAARHRLRRPRFQSLALGAPLTWKYRGQVVPTNRLIQVEADVRSVVPDDAGVTVTADGALWVDGLRIYLAHGLALRIVESG